MVNIPKDNNIFPSDAHSKHFSESHKKDTSIEEGTDTMAEQKHRISVRKQYFLLLIPLSVLIWLFGFWLSSGLGPTGNAILDFTESAVFNEIDINLSEGILSSNSIDYTVNIDQSDIYSVFILSNFDARRHKLFLDNKPLAQNVYGEEYLWVSLGDVRLSEGMHTLRITSPFSGINLLDDGSFETGTWKDVGDCCNGLPGEAKLEARQNSDSTHGKYSLELSSENHCACVYQQIKNITKKKLYVVSLDYKGDLPLYCVWNQGCDACTPAVELESANTWKKHTKIIETDLCTGTLSIHLDSNSDGKGTVVNLYDNIVVQEFLPGIREIKFVKR